MLTFRPPAVQDNARTLPGSYYTSDEVFQLDLERIFARQWTCVGRAEQIARPGDYFLVQLGVESLIITRDPAGQPRALYNVCRHRGTRMCEEAEGHFAGSIQCPYHAWTYGLDGSLLAARLMQEVAGFDKRDYPLYQAHIAEWEGFLFLNLAREPEPFEQAFAPLLGRFAAWGIPGLRRAHRIEYDVAANWKLMIENYSECYHCPLVHPALSQLSPPTSGRNDLLDGPFLGGYMELNPQVESMTLDGHSSRPAIGKVVGDDLDRVYYYAIFPNLLLSLHPDYVMSHILWPEAAGRTRIVCEWHFDPATMARPDFNPMDAVEFWDLTNRQDWKVCELSHLGLRSRVYTPGPYAHSEGLLYAFDQEYLRRLEIGD